MQQQQPAHFHPNYAVAYEDINPSSTFYYGHQQQGQLQYQQQQQLQQQVSMTPVAHNMNIVDTLLYDVEEQQPAPAFTHMVTPSHANKQSSRKDNRKRPKRKQVKNACGKHQFFLLGISWWHKRGSSWHKRSSSALWLFYIHCSSPLIWIFFF